MTHEELRKSFKTTKNPYYKLFILFIASVLYKHCDVINQDILTDLQSVLPQKTRVNIELISKLELIKYKNAVHDYIKLHKPKTARKEK